MSSMPPTWSNKPDRSDPVYRRYGDRINFAFNIAMFCFIMSGVWFFKLLRHAQWDWTSKLTLIWLATIALQGIYVFAIATYEGIENSPPIQSSSKKQS
jgi:hypothetical protein